MKINDELGKNDFRKPPLPASRKQRILLLSFLGLALFLFLGGDHWPSKKTYFWAQRGMVEAFEKMRSIPPALRYNQGGAADYSVYYLLLLKLFYYYIPQRMFCLRMVSVVSSLLAMYFLYLLATRLFCRVIALVFLFLLSTSPIYLESARSFGYIPFSNLMFILAAYVLIRSLDSGWGTLKIFILALLCFMALSVYVSARLIIPLVILFYLLHFRTEGKKLMVFLVLFIGLIVSSDWIFPDAHFDWGEMLRKNDPEWIRSHGSSHWQTTSHRLLSNAKNSWEYLSNRHRAPFTDDGSSSRLFDASYTPFLFLGLIICLVKRNRSTVFLLLWFVITFFSPLPSSYNAPRRIIASLPALYLLIALGLFLFYNMVSGLSFLSRYRSVIAGVGLLFLGAVGAYDIFEYALVVSKPRYNYSRVQLKTLGDFILTELDQDYLIRCSYPTRDLIWGNPYFINRFRDPRKALKVRPYVPELRTLKDNMTWAVEENKKLVYLYALPTYPHGFSRPRDCQELFQDIDFLRSHYPDKLYFGSLPGTGVHYVSSARLGSPSPALFMDQEIHE